MTSDENLRAIFREVLALPTTTDLARIQYRSTPGWDSLAHMQLVGALESHFDIMLETQDVLDMSSFARAIEILRKYDVHAAP